MALTDESKIIDINLETSKKQQIRINGNNNAIIELNLSDFGIIERLETGYSQLQGLAKEVAEIKDDDISANIKAVDRKMRDLVDYIFDSKVSDTCCPSGTMIDLKDGEYYFEHIINTLTKLYESNINSEYKLLKARVSKKAEQYIPQDHKPKKAKVKKVEHKNDGEQL